MIAEENVVGLKACAVMFGQQLRGDPKELVDLVIEAAVNTEAPDIAAELAANRDEAERIAAAAMGYM